ncbi:MAG: hypothetical protein K9M57_03110 [Phycisphaerae bacterium]|nr:hypothetical protein [Phycisphaerae bacterium]
MTFRAIHWGKNNLRPAPVLPGRLVLITLGLAMFFQAGCTQPQRQAESKPVRVHSDMVTLWPLCQEAIKERGFQIYYRNFNQGILETYPLISKQWFEPWHSDVVDGRSLLESSMHTLQRQVTLEIIRVDDQQHELKCRVDVERISLTEDFTSNLVRARDMLSNSNMQLIKDPDDLSDIKQWVPLGNDAALEEAILRSISSKL